MSYTLDVKLTVWERYEFDSKEQMLDVKAKLENGELSSSIDVGDYLNKDTELLLDTSEEMSIEDNGNCATMEILDDDGETIWQNA